jgi:peptidoglycan/LPS O-acetylase OafA/YrhL
MSGSAQPGGGRTAAIDVVKGLAILGVIAQHGLTPEIMLDTRADWWYRQAVPVLIVLMGMNAARSSLRRPPISLAEAYGARYWRARFRRILLPLLVAVAAAAVVGAASNRLHIEPFVLAGQFPMPGPGDYWVTILLTFTLIWPAWMHLFRRRPGLVVAAAIVLDVGFELASVHVPAFQTELFDYAYDACILRYFAAIAVGMWLAIDDQHARRRRLVVLALAPLSLLYIDKAGNDPSAFPYLLPGFTLATNAAAVPWAAAMLLAALRFWPAGGVPGTGWLERLGVASYEVFLVQIVWFGVLPEHGDGVRFLGDAVACGLLGWGLYRALTMTARTGTLRLRRRELARS